MQSSCDVSPVPRHPRPCTEALSIRSNLKRDVALESPGLRKLKGKGELVASRPRAFRCKEKRMPKVGRASMRLIIGLMVSVRMKRSPRCWRRTS